MTRSPLRPLARPAAPAAFAAALLALGCAAEPGSTAAALDVTLRDFDVDLPPGSIAAGDYELAIHNLGPTVHELVIARTPADANALPMMRHGRAADEPSLETVAADEFIELDTVDRLDVALAPGHYVLYCNIDGHYAAGMYADLDVAGGD